MNEKPHFFSPKDVLKIIFNKLLGNFYLSHVRQWSLILIQFHWNRRPIMSPLCLKRRCVQYWIELLINFYSHLYYFKQFHVLPSEIAQANGGNDIDEAVITVPFHFDDKQRTATRLVSQTRINSVDWLVINSVSRWINQ